MEWNEQFFTLFDRCLSAYQAGNKDYQSYYSAEDLTFLGSIGCKPRELFDFVEDLGDCGSPSRSTALLVAAVRRDYFLAVQSGNSSTLELTGQDVPSREDSLEGMPYLPRIIKKAEAKLRGELHPDLMFGCGGDRRFLQSHGNIPMADFLRNVWAADGDTARIASYVLSQKNA